MSGPADPLIVKVLSTRGYHSEAAQRAAREALRRTGVLQNPGKERMSAAKLGQVDDILARELSRACSADVCRRAARTAKPAAAIVEVSQADCEICTGSEQRRAAARLRVTTGGSVRKRVVVVGGSPETRRELEDLAGPIVDLRTVDGTARMTQERARGDLGWADLVLIWGSTQLAHKVSNLYRGERVITVPKRGVAAALDCAADWFERR